MTIERLDLPGGVLDDSILVRVAAIAQQCNCVGCDGRGLAAGVAMLVCTALVLMVTVQPRGLFVSSSRAGNVIEKTQP